MIDAAKNKAADVHKRDELVTAAEVQFNKGNK